MAIQRPTPSNRFGSLILVAGMVFGAFMLSYNWAASRAQAQGESPLVPFGAATGGSASSGGDGCCGGGGGGTPIEGAMTVEGDVQKLTVDTSSGSFNPNIVKAKAGVPIELTFTQSPGGCLSGVVFPDLQVNEDLTSGEKTVKLPALDAGEYQFSCQMQMVTGTLVVE